MRELREIGYGFSGPEKRLSKQELTSEQFSDYARLTGSLTINGKTLEQTLNEYFASPAWQNLSEERKRYRANGQVMTVELRSVSRIMGAYKRAAREELMKKYPELRDAIMTHKKMTKGLDLLASNR